MLDHYTTGLTYFFTLIVIVTCSISIIYKCMVGIRMVHLIGCLGIGFVKNVLVSSSIIPSL